MPEPTPSKYTLGIYIYGKRGPGEQKHGWNKLYADIKGICGEEGICKKHKYIWNE